MRKCTNGHEMEHAGKHCGECGGLEQATMHKCTCGTEMVKSASSKFCTGCGTAVEAEADLDQAIEGLVTFEKSRQAVEADLGDLPEVPSVAADDAEVTAILKAATVVDAHGAVEGLRPDPLFEAVLSGQATGAADVRALFGHQQKWNEHNAAALGVMAKAMLAMGRELAMLKGQVIGAGKLPRTGAKTGTVTDATARIAASAAANADTGNDTRLRGRALFQKCKQAGTENPELALGIEEIGALEQHVNLNHSLVEMVKSKRAGLARRVAELIGEEMPSKDELATVH